MENCLKAQKIAAPIFNATLHIYIYPRLSVPCYDGMRFEYDYDDDERCGCIIKAMFITKFICI